MTHWVALSHPPTRRSNWIFIDVKQCYCATCFVRRDHTHTHTHTHTTPVTDPAVSETNYPSSKQSLTAELSRAVKLCDDQQTSCISTRRARNSAAWLVSDTIATLTFYHHQQRSIPSPWQPSRRSVIVVTRMKCGDLGQSWARLRNAICWNWVRSTWHRLHRRDPHITCTRLLLLQCLRWVTAVNNAASIFAQQ